jgi:heparosan-N-sulfate-glucuronate 5-epimerase
MHKYFIPNDFWHGKKSPGAHWQPDRVAGYYTCLIHKTRPYGGPLSALGVPLVRHSGQAYLHPVTVCQVALGWYERWLEEESESDLERFFGLADWLLENEVTRAEVGGVWPVPYGVGLYGLAPGWISALVQGQALSVLARAWYLTRRDAYLATARRGLGPFYKTVSNGGVRAELSGGRVVFEEYPTAAPSVVLNGFISTLWGLRDVSHIGECAEAGVLYEQGLSSLVGSLHEYDTGFWSRYSQYESPRFSNLASPYYHQEHIVQLYVMHALTGEPIFLETARRWERYGRSPLGVARVLWVKTSSRIACRLG